jgi:C-terminal processing protease CtpA/Prc
MRSRTSANLALLLAALFAFFGNGLSVLAVPQEPNRTEPTLPLTPEEAGTDADLLMKVARDIHPGYTRYRDAEDAVAAEGRFREVVAGVEEVGELYLAVSEFLAKIRCEHTEAELPPAIAEWRNSHPTMLPVAFQRANGKAIITGIAPGVTGITIGDELRAVDGHLMADLFKEIAPFLSVDGFTDQTKETLFSGSDDIGLTTFDVFYPLLHGFRDSFELRVRSEEGQEPTVEVPAVDEKASLAARGKSTARKNLSDAGAASWRQVGDAAVLSISTFVNYRMPVDPDEVFGPVFREIRDSDVERLVVDLRNVGGGSTDAMSRLLAHLIDGPVTIGGPSRVKTYDFSAYREHLGSWDESVFEMPASLFTADGSGLYLVSPDVTGGAATIEPAREAWRGPLTVLIGPHNESGATMLLAELRDEREVTFIGRPTGGSAEGPTAGVIAFLELPASKITVRVPLIWNTTSYEDFESGRGIEPDILVPLTVEDLRAGRDAALVRATTPDKP